LASNSVLAYFQKYSRLFFPGAADILRQLVRMPYNCLHLKRKQDFRLGVSDSQGGVNGDKRRA